MQTVFLYELICLINEGGVPEDIAIAMKTLKGTYISIAVIWQLYVYSSAILFP